MKDGTVDVYAVDPSQFKAFLAKQMIPLPATARVVKVSEIARPAVDIYGGLNLSSCTSGFSVRKAGTTTDGILTAGHCVNAQSYAGTSLPFQSEAFSGSHDEQWHTTPGFTPTNEIKWQDDGSTRTITSRVFWSSQSIGATICKYGLTTSYDCAEIQVKNLAPGYVPNASPTFIRASRLHTDMASPGDSGGPVFFGNGAYGITSGSVSGGPDTDDLIYVAEDYIEIGLNVTVKTS